ncbi:MAG: glycosyltransferase family 2 protein [Candidatus Niyogibacteria bacterium]|nr:glycosyltransferase family 2 protein [Candidatus Niyogibacteria bacterium]
MKDALVTIGLPVYNVSPREAWFRRAIGSLLVQTYPHFELIIADDGSIDETSLICKEYADRDNRIRYIRHEKNQGQLANIYFVLRAAKGKYFMLASDDDIWEPHFIEKLIEPLEKNPQYHVAMGSFDRFYDDGSPKDRIILQNDLDCTCQNHLAVHKKILFDAPLHIYLYGLFRTPFLRKIFSRPAPRCLRWDRVVMAEIALATPFFSVPERVFLKQYNRVSSRVRYAGQQIGKMYYVPFAYTRYVGMIGWWVLTSRMVPLHRKLLQLPNWALFAWSGKRGIFREIMKALSVS